MRKILLLEINEVPWKVVDLWRHSSRYPNLKYFFDNAQLFETIARDVGELSPWVTWPTLHRGIPNFKHGIKNLGQDPITFNGVPIWEEFRNVGLNVGVCGSMQSWPPKDPGDGGFFVPDTFAHDATCIPKFVETFQRFNLEMVRKNGRVVNREMNLTTSGKTFLREMPRLGIKAKTLASLAAQVVKERFDSRMVARRPIFQSMLQWDVFEKLYDPKAPPSFASFFTNHVAGTMHRYWHHLFPEDFGEKYVDLPRYHLKTFDFAFSVADQIVKRALWFSKLNPEITIIFASSMGQAAVDRDYHEGFEVVVGDLVKFISITSLGPSDWKPLLAMVPQVSVEIGDAEKRKQAKMFLESCLTSSRQRLFFVDEIGSSLTITVKTPASTDRDIGGFWNLGGFLKWEDSGLKIIEIEPGTAYHIPQGVLAIHEKRLEGKKESIITRIDATEVKEMILKIAGITRSVH